MYDLPLIRLSGSLIRIFFFVTKGNSITMVVNEVLHQSYQLWPKNLLANKLCMRGFSEK